MKKTNDVELISYNASQLSEVLGVSVAAIHNWIDEGRFIDYVKEPNNSVTIINTTGFKMRDGKIESIKIIIERYKEDKNKSFAKDDEIAMLESEIKLLQKKYGGKDNEEVFNTKNLTNEQESDLSRWNFYKMRLENLL